MSTSTTDGAGTSVPAPAVGPDGQTLTIPCPDCEGSGVVPQDHGGGMVEHLGCPSCWHPDERLAGEGRVWRLHLLHPDPLGPWLVRDKLRDDLHLSTVGRGRAEELLHLHELALCHLAEAHAEAAVVATAKAWRRDRASGDLPVAMAADGELLAALGELDAAALAVTISERAGRGR